MSNDDIQYIRAKLDEVDSKVDKHSVILAKNTVILDEHIRRTALLEERVEDIDDHVASVRGFFKYTAGLLAIASTFAGLLYAAAKLL